MITTQMLHYISWEMPNRYSKEKNGHKYYYYIAKKCYIQSSSAISQIIFEESNSIINYVTK